MPARLTCNSCLFLLQIDEPKTSVLPQIEGSPLHYQGPYDATSILTWFNTVGPRYMVDGTGRKIPLPTQSQLDAGEFKAEGALAKCEKHTASIPWQGSRGPL